MALHVEVTAAHAINRRVNVKARFAAEVGEHEVIDVKLAARAADVGPLLIFRAEGAIERGAHAIWIQKLPRELHRHGQAALAGVLAKQSSGDAAWELLIHGPERKADVVPAEIAQAAEGLKIALHANVACQKLVGGFKAELRGDAADGADGLLVVQHAAHQTKAPAVHEHDAIHELHVAPPTGIQNFAQVSARDGTWLFAQDVFTCLGRAYNPFLPHGGGQRQINGIDIVAGKQLLVAAACRWHG